MDNNKVTNDINGNGGNGDFHIFQIEGCGRVIADLSRDELPPIIQFEDGVYCFGLPRTHDEVSPLGYESIAEGNFIHEALHIFVAHKTSSVETSVAYREGLKVDWEDTNNGFWRDAISEEQLVLGLQILVNDTLGDFQTTNKVGGFVLHIVGGAVGHAKRRFKDEFGLDIDELKAEFMELLDASGCLKRVFSRKAKPEINHKPINDGDFIKVWQSRNDLTKPEVETEVKRDYLIEFTDYDMEFTGGIKDR